VNPTFLSWGIAAMATAGVITRPFKWPEAIWAVAGALLIVVLGLLPVTQALQAVAKGSDVYFFLFGMMLLSEVGRREGLFDWIAVLAVNHAKGSPARLFLLVYLVGVVVTTFLSNDAAAVVLTPAVFAAAKKANTKPLPVLFVCAFIANAASFVLPISNPANLVLYGNHTPALSLWMGRFIVPSALSILTTYFMLRWSQRLDLRGECKSGLDNVPLSSSGRIALGGIAVTAIGLLSRLSLRHATRPTNGDPRCDYRRYRIDPGTRIPLGYGERHLLECSTVGGRIVCDGRGAAANRRYRA
jgi:arsenical pump membrane protein